MTIIPINSSLSNNIFNIESYHEKQWWEVQKEIETRPTWGQYYDDLFPLEDFESWIDRPIFGWSTMCINEKISIEEIYEITKWLKENIDNVWEGPIGYMGFWKFRFTDEADRMAFKLFVY